MAQVVLDVEVGVVGPDRPAQIEGHAAHHLAVARDQRQLGVDHGQHVGEQGRGTFEDGHRGNVHVADVVLEVEERRIQRTQPVIAHSVLPSEGQRNLPDANAPERDCRLPPALQFALEVMRVRAPRWPGLFPHRPPVWPAHSSSASGVPGQHRKRTRDTTP